jgi:hypothetical protein
MLVNVQIVLMFIECSSEKRNRKVTNSDVYQFKPRSTYSPCRMGCPLAILDESGLFRRQRVLTQNSVRRTQSLPGIAPH